MGSHPIRSDHPGPRGEASVSTAYAVYSLQDGGYAWVWNLPDGAAIAGTADTEQQAMQDAERTISEFYANAH